MFNTKKHHSISSSCLPMQEKVHSPSTSSTCVGSGRLAPFSHHSQIAALPAWDTVCTEMQTPCLCSTVLELFCKMQEAGSHYFSVCFPEENAVQNGGSCEVVLQVPTSASPWHRGRGREVEPSSLSFPESFSCAPKLFLRILCSCNTKQIQTPQSLQKKAPLPNSCKSLPKCWCENNYNNQ